MERVAAEGTGGEMKQERGVGVPVVLHGVEGPGAGTWPLKRNTVAKFANL